MKGSYPSQSIGIFPTSKATFKSYTYKNRTLRWSTLGSFNSTQHKEKKKDIFDGTGLKHRGSPEMMQMAQPWWSYSARPLASLARCRSVEWLRGLFLAWCLCKMHSSCNVCWLMDGWHVTPSALKDNQNNRFFPPNFWGKALKSLLRACSIQSMPSLGPVTSIRLVMSFFIHHYGPEREV